MAISKFVPLVLIVVFLGLAMACGKAPAATPAGGAPATQPGSQPAAQPTARTTQAPAGGAAPGATAAPTTRAGTPTGAGALPGGLPFPAAKPKTGDWAKYSMMMGTTTQKVLEIRFGGTTYEGMETVTELTGIPGMPSMPEIPSIPGAPPIPGMPTGPTASLFLSEKGNPSGKSWVVTKTGAQIQCSRVGTPGQPTPAPRDAEQLIKPDMTLLGTDTYKVPETGQTIKVWKYRSKVTVQGQTMEQEMWVSNEVPTYSVKLAADDPSTPGTTMMTMMELLGFGSGAPISVTAAELEANCK